jgi:hypothetical protein
MKKLGASGKKKKKERPKIIQRNSRVPFYSMPGGRNKNNYHLLSNTCETLLSIRSLGQRQY